ncbi:CCAAT/ENHANCER BINDING PROTEIN [Salix koriyanagi]|uniref:CCAAT/ENHANCER BINDING PROTEIN n=1 Tax=Salix koriyanagi TaxID=2511006 RepID=A0A9Q0Q9Y6_9ROSI|nr:CCAAT/ENHANCER BINDING PROTEIN [Salix koriyanagi]
MKNYNMDDGEVELSDHVLLPNPDSSGSLQSSVSVDSLLDEFLNNTRTCTHTHTCNPIGPDAIHTHTCYHTHTQVITSEEDDDLNNRENSNSKAKRPAGNREAVRKYREKKKAHTAYLEEEVKKLRTSNQQLVRKIQQQVILEAEVLRLRSIMVELRGKIDTELGVLPFQNQGDTIAAFKDGNCGAGESTGGPVNLQCQTDLPCFHTQVVGSSSQVSIDGDGKLMESWEGNCQPVMENCQANMDNMATATEGHAMEMVEALMSSASRVQ